jgi:hypothetical protein
VLLSLVCLILLRGEKGKNIQPVILASLLSWAYFVRPTAVFYIVPITLFMWLRHRSLFLAFLGTMLLHWWAGVAYGPRIHTGLVPVFVLLGVIGIDAARNHNQGPSRVSEGWLIQSVKGFKILAVSFCILAGIFIHGVGTMTSYAGWPEGVPYASKYRPVSTFFDWGSAPFLCYFSRETFCPKLTKDQIYQEFESVDLDHDSSIDRNEYESAGFRNFHKLDRDGNFQVNLEEWQKMFKM